MIIRKEEPGDETAIRRVTQAAFASMPHSNGAEPRIIDALRSAGELSLSLVAVENGDVIGQVTFSPVTIDGIHNGWFGLGPIAVAPERQGKGVGGALVRAGLDAIKRNSVDGGCVLVGNPDYYRRFGFRGASGLTYGDIDPRYVQQVAFAGKEKTGSVLYAPAFEKAAAR